jgi:hypothetical protein
MIYSFYQFILERQNKFINHKTFDLEKWYDKLNKHFYSGKLPKVDLRWNDMKTNLGVLKYDNKGNIDHLGISKNFKLTQEEVLSVLLHEMIHVWQVVNKKTDGHGKHFQKEMERVNKKSKWGTKVLIKQPMEHLKMTNPDLSRDYGIIIIKKSEKDYEIAIFDPQKVDYKVLVEILKQRKNISVEVRKTQNGIVKKYEKESNKKEIITYKLDSLTFNTLMNDSRKITGFKL